MFRGEFFDAGLAEVLAVVFDRNSAHATSLTEIVPLDVEVLEKVKIWPGVQARYLRSHISGEVSPHAAGCARGSAE
jgi:hypothetical protein